MEINGFYSQFQTRLQAQAAGIPYQGLCDTACSESNTVRMLFVIPSITFTNHFFLVFVRGR